MFGNHLKVHNVSSLLLLLLMGSTDALIDNITMAIDTDMSIYYNQATNATLAIELADASRLPIQPVKFISQGLPCACGDLKCGCCAGINITMIKFDRLTCANITVVPEEFALDFNLFMDEEKIMTSRLTARNPPAVCVPLYFLPVVTFCVRIFDLHYSENKFNACVDFETRISNMPIFILHFNCLKFGGDGVMLTRPAANITKPEVYDSVDFGPIDDDPAYLHTSTRTPEEEQQIGTLKI